MTTIPDDHSPLTFGRGAWPVLLALNAAVADGSDHTEPGRREHSAEVLRVDEPTYSRSYGVK